MEYFYGGFGTSTQKEFQLERIILFSDAVFAIAITLLVLEIKVPEIEGNTDQDLLNTLYILLQSLLDFC